MTPSPSRLLARGLAAVATFGFVVGGAVLALGFRESSRVVGTEAGRPTRERGEVIHGVPVAPAEDPRKAELGARLFIDARLSADGTVSCASCHDLSHGGADGRPTAVGIRGQVGAVNTPTVFNAALNPTQFWDGRAASLVDQIDGPVQNPSEMGSRWSDVVDKVNRDPEYAARFKRAYGGSASADNIKDAIATFERTLVMRDSRFDRYLAGDGALDAQEIRGFELFKSYGCASCHQGRNVGGNIYEKLGIVADYFADRGTDIAASDLGRYNVTKRAEDRFLFRVPSLRFVTATAPYLHDGSIATLEEAIAVMGRYQLGEEIPTSDNQAIAAFLGTLSSSNASVALNRP